jgi:hypothetical protein
VPVATVTAAGEAAKVLSRVDSQVLVAEGTPSLQVIVMVTCVLPCLNDTVGDGPACLSP